MEGREDEKGEEEREELENKEDNKTTSSSIFYSFVPHV